MKTKQFQELLNANPLTGSPKQRQWGSQIRRQVVQKVIGKNNLVLAEMLAAQITEHGYAGWWIKMRECF